MNPLKLAPFKFIPTGCGVCGGPLKGTILGCERCGIGLHDGCYMAAVASAIEREQLTMTEKDVAILCTGCRS